jgi:glyoxylase-like metal-dependent hydrolase (beta-lactamase superfamily II)/rhodanese-related sulfurtransferase
VLLRQFLDSDLGCASYLIADEESRDAVLVDPAYAVDQYLEEVEREGLCLTRVLETHTHADHVSGHGRLALEQGLPVAVHAAAGAEYPHEPLEDGDEVPVGSLRVRTIHAPGHRPEHCCFLAGDALLTGDSLFVGGVARPDLAVDAREGAEGLFRSLHRLLELPDSVRVFPGHVAGSLCGTGMSTDASTTIGRERTLNAALAIATVEQFVDEQTSRSTPRPPNMERIVELNRGPFVGPPRPLRRVEDADGATVLDVRPADAFAAGHLPGAISVPVGGGSFGTRVGFLVGVDEPFVLYASSPAEAELAARRLHAIGFLELAGYVDGAAGATETMATVDVGDLERLLGSVELLDVREGDEWKSGYIPGSRHLPYRLTRTCSDCLPRDRPIVTICETGARAAIAASVLAAAGFDARPVLHGGIDDWARRGGETVTFRRCGG